MWKEGGVTEGESTAPISAVGYTSQPSQWAVQDLSSRATKQLETTLSRTPKSTQLLSLSKAGQSLLPQLPQTPSAHPPNFCSFLGSKPLMSLMTISHPWFIFLRWSQILPPAAAFTADPKPAPGLELTPEKR